jgi:Flp pilus assembly protein TadD
MKTILILVTMSALALHGNATAAEPSIPTAQLEVAQQARDSFEKGDYRAAERHYEQLLLALPDNLLVLSNLGVVRFRVGKYKAAVEVLVRATKLAPNDAFAHRMLGIIYSTEGKHDAARAELERADKLERDKPRELKGDKPSPHGLPESGDYPTPLENERLQKPVPDKVATPHAAGQRGT